MKTYNNLSVSLLLLLCTLFAFTAADEGTSTTTDSNVQLEVFSGSNQWWTAMTIRGIETVSMEIKDARFSWSPMSYVDSWGYWTFNTVEYPFSFPISLRFTTKNGEQYVITDAVHVIDGATQFVDITGLDSDSDRPGDEIAVNPIIVTEMPTEAPTNAPTDAPTNAATDAPTNAATDAPTNAATDAPTNAATDVATDAAFLAPTDAPSAAPTDAPSAAPTDAPSTQPMTTEAPTTTTTTTPIPTKKSTPKPTKRPTTTKPTTTTTTIKPTTTSTTTTSTTTTTTIAPTTTTTTTKAPTTTTTAPTTTTTTTPAPTTTTTTTTTTVKPTTTTTTKPTTSGAGCSAPMGIMVPLYVYPGAAWDSVIAGAKQGVPTIAIINPNSGPGNGPDANYRTYMQKMADAGVEMVGYVHTSWGSRDINTVKAEINKWASEFPHISGIFLDEGSVEAKDLPYYANLYTYIMGFPGWKHDIVNPGAIPDQGYFSVSTQMVAYESYASTLTTDTPSWANCNNKDHFVAMVHSSTSSDYRSIINRVKQLSYYGWVYVTDGTQLCCIYNKLAVYYADEATYIASINK